MCDGTLIASLLLAAAGSAAEAKQASEQRSSFNALTDGVFGEEQKRQDLYSGALDDEFQESLASNAPMALNIGEAREKAKFQNMLQNRADAKVVSRQMPGAQNAPRVVNKEVDRQLAKAATINQRDVGNLVALRGMEQAMQNAGVARGRHGQNLAVIGRNAQASDNLVPMELEAAKQKSMGAGSGYGDLAGILKLAALGTGLYGGYQAGAAGAAKTGGKVIGGPIRLSPSAAATPVRTGPGLGSLY
jgi:hypothetical protein